MPDDAPSLPLHSEPPEDETWDLAKLCPDVDAWESDFARIDEAMKTVLARRDDLTESPASLATGFAAAAQLARGIIAGDSKRVGAYLDFLRAGDTKDVLDLLRDVGVDLETPQPVQAAVDLFKETADKLQTALL